MTNSRNDLTEDDRRVVREARASLAATNETALGQFKDLCPSPRAYWAARADAETARRLIRERFQPGDRQETPP